jgi:hypothetical protein
MNFKRDPIDLKKYLLQVVNRYVFVLDQLVNMVNVDIVISYDVFHRNILQQYIQLFDHFQVEEEIYKEMNKMLSLSNNFCHHLRLILCRFSRNIANAIFTFHITTMSDFNFET